METLKIPDRIALVAANIPSNVNYKCNSKIYKNGRAKTEKSNVNKKHAYSAACNSHLFAEWSKNPEQAHFAKLLEFFYKKIHNAKLQKKINWINNYLIISASLWFL